jgi:hypothetical protein
MKENCANFYIFMQTEEGKTEHAENETGKSYIDRPENADLS